MVPTHLRIVCRFMYTPNVIIPKMKSIWTPVNPQCGNVVTHLYPCHNCHQAYLHTDNLLRVIVANVANKNRIDVAPIQPKAYNP